MMSEDMHSIFEKNEDQSTDPTNKPYGCNSCKTCLKEYKGPNVPYQSLDEGTFGSEKTTDSSPLCQQKTSSSSSEQQSAKPGEVPCDVCTGIKLKALKSCLDCQVSYCEIHLESHLTTPGLKRHQLIDPVDNLESRMCKKHGKLLELFCKDKEMYLCIFCAFPDHRTHDVVPLVEENKGKKAELRKTEAQIKQMIQERQLKIEELKESVELSDKDAEREKAEGNQVFDVLMETVQKTKGNFNDSIMEKQKKTRRQAEGFITELQQEIWELEKRSSEVEQLSRSEDHLHLHQNFTTLNAAPPTKNWTGVSIQKPSFEWDLSQAVSQLEKQFSEEVKKATLSVVQKYEVDITLDPDVAHPDLVVSDDGKGVRSDNVQMNSSERSDTSPSVLASQSFSSGRFYYEVQVKGKTGWDLGVVQINRKGGTVLSPLNGVWVLLSRDGNQYYAAAGPEVHLTLQSDPERVGVFVDYEEGLVSVFDVDTAAVIYCYTGCSFTEKICPYFSPGFSHAGVNSAPLIISPANHTE